MASDLSTGSQFSLTTIDELEELEMTEFDVTMLRELLEEPKEEALDDKVYSMEMERNSPLEDNYQCLDSMIDDIQDVNWLHIMEESPFPCHDIGNWYQGSCTEETVDIVETRQLYDYFRTPSPALVTSDEIAYIGLWEHDQIS
ncbi:Hypothetical predicted protein [Olea europaea subsp. europaea]|uniref:Uncharacterized protein n=1 Tax=Olea europaea subsp. europaea TaxID=158383 RepID=A0A8S0RHX1_OLEEU|nr:Hypothetical predicted protein [Olea europaea subsp. europaea]